MTIKITTPLLEKIKISSPHSTDDRLMLRLHIGENPTIEYVFVSRQFHGKIIVYDFNKSTNAISFYLDGEYNTIKKWFKILKKDLQKTITKVKHEHKKYARLFEK